MFAIAAVALALERVTYASIWHRPGRFATASRRILPALDPVDVVARLFVVFKVVQALVFVAWCVVHAGGAVAPARSAGTLFGGSVLLVAGQVLNLTVFARLGVTGVFYGNRLGHDLAWIDGFPFTWTPHPQYVGTVLSIWGFFIVMRFPAPDWIALPLLETVYYTFGSWAERSSAGPRIMPARPAPATAPDRLGAGRLR